MSNAEEITTDLGYQPFDADNHYYEAEDAFTRHLDPKLGPRVIEWCQIGKRKYHVIGGQVSRAVTNPTFDPVSPAGAMADYFRGNPSGKTPMEYLGRPEPIRPAYRDRDARLATMDEHGLQKLWLFPTLGMIYEEPLKHDPEAVTHLFTAFNRWLQEDWGFSYQDRIFAGPYISLCDVDWAVKELEWALDNDARTIVMRPAPIHTANGVLAPADPVFDPFWARVNESGVTVVVHAGDTGYSLQGYAPEKGFSASFSGGFRPNLGALHIGIERAIYDFLGSIMVDKIFERFPNIRLASVENGSGFLGDLFKKMRGASAKMPGYFGTDPVELFRTNVWMNPFWEDDVRETADAMGTDRVIFGSDWPHIEGMEHPLDYVAELKVFSDEDRKRILLDNVTELNTRRPA
jgi:predicted TIM-barrel fold metal-dependent hydrolase